jgi:hypothetical protein
LVFALGIAVLGGCDTDSPSNLVAPVELPMFTGDTIACPDSVYSGCMEANFLEDNPFLDGLALWYQEIEGPTSACTAAYNEAVKILSGLTDAVIFTYSGHSGGSDFLAETLVDDGPPRKVLALGLHRGENYGVAADGSVDDPTDIGWILGHEGFHTVGLHDIDNQTGNTTPGGMSSICANWDPPV